MILIVNKYFFSKGFKGLSLWPFVILSDKKDIKNAVLINHERIHLKQQAELLLFPFYIWYAIEFVLGYIKHRNGYIAYKNISFEREAYKNEKDLTYCKSRKLWAFTKFL